MNIMRNHLVYASQIRQELRQMYVLAVGQLNVHCYLIVC